MIGKCSSAALETRQARGKTLLSASPMALEAAKRIDIQFDIEFAINGDQQQCSTYWATTAKPLPAISTLPFQAGEQTSTSNYHHDR